MDMLFVQIYLENIGKENMVLVEEGGLVWI